MKTANAQKEDSKLIFGDGGFSLIELLIAMSILALGMLAAASMQLSAVRNNTTGNTSTQANMLAETQLEFLKNQAIDSTDLQAGSYQDPTAIDLNGNPGGIYSRSWNIEEITSQLRRITITVSWNRFGRNRNVTLVSNTRGGGI